MERRTDMITRTIIEYEKEDYDNFKRDLTDEEAANMQEINETVASVSTVVDNNSATSEETAAVSEEQKAQVETMVQMMARFKI